MPAFRPACLPAGLPTGWQEDLPCLLKFVRHRQSYRTNPIRHRHACSQKLSFKFRIVFSGSGMPAFQMSHPCLRNIVRRRHAGMPDVGVMPSVSRPAPACRTWQSCPLYLVRRRHAGMPDDVVIPLVSHPAPACRHA